MRTNTSRFLIVLMISLVGCAHSKPQDFSDVKPDPAANADVNSMGHDASLTAFVENPLRWKFVSEVEGIRIYKDVQASPGRIGLRGKTVLNASIAKVATALTETDVRKRWMSGLVETRVLRMLSDYERIEYGKIRAQWPYQFSDFIYKMTFSILREPRTLLIRMSQVNDQSVPVPMDTARGEVTNSSNFVRQIDPTHSELVIEMGLDPKGALPSWNSQGQVVQWFDDTMIALKAVVEEPRFKVSDRVQNYIVAHQL